MLWIVWLSLLFTAFVIALPVCLKYRCCQDGCSCSCSLKLCLSAVKQSCCPHKSTARPAHSRSVNWHKPDKYSSVGSDGAAIIHVNTIDPVTSLNGIDLAVTSFANEDEVNAILDVWKYCCVVKDEDTIEYISRLVKLQWNQNLSGVGQDARGLQHTAVKVRSVYVILNHRLLRRYQKTLCDVTKRHSLPSELKNRPIATGAIRPSVELMTSLPAGQTASATSQQLSYALETGETFLFHGTGKLQIDCIIRDGFNIKYAKRGLYGHPGIYFSEHAQKADQYTDGGQTRRDTDLYMLVVRVALGKTEMYEKQKPNVQYDTIVGGEKALFREFVKVRTAQLYPQYLICYDRV